MSSGDFAHQALKLVEECAGMGELSWRDRVFQNVRYEIKRFQGMARSGLPIPGLHRIEGSVDLASVPQRAELIDTDLTLRLEDGRSLRVILADEDGRVLAEGHGPSRCTCC
jgi:hypothetical protein